MCFFIANTVFEMPGRIGWYGVRIFFCDWDMWGWTIPDGMIVCDKPHIFLIKKAVARLSARFKIG